MNLGRLVYRPVQELNERLRADVEHAVDLAGMQMSRESSIHYRAKEYGLLTWVQRMFWPEEWESIDLVMAQGILSSIKSEELLPAIRVIERPIGQPSCDPALGQEIGWQVIDDEGFHLYHLARAVGITHVYTRWMEPYYDKGKPLTISYRPKNR